MEAESIALVSEDTVVNYDSSVHSQRGGLILLSAKKFSQAAGPKVIQGQVAEGKWNMNLLFQLQAKDGQGQLGSFGLSGLTFLFALNSFRAACLLLNIHVLVELSTNV